MVSLVRPREVLIARAKYVRFRVADYGKV